MPCLLAGAGYAALLYSAKAPWSRRLNYGLAALRFVVVSFLCFLLLSPFINTTTTTTEKPTIVLAVDNSQSVALFTPKPVLSQAISGLRQLTAALQAKGFTVETRPLAGPARPADSLRFTAASTDLNALLSGIQESYDGRNLAGVVLASDGIVNQGQSPTFSEFRFPIYSLALGDTVPKKDLSIPALTYNRVAFSGNRFPIEADLTYDGFAGGAAVVQLRENGRVLQTRRVALPAGQRRIKVAFTVVAPAPGKRRYEVVVERQAGEFTVLNNSKFAYLEVVKGKLRVLLAGAAPHPDLKALRAAIQGNDNFDLVTYLPSISALKAGQDYDVAILHQLPARSGVGAEVLAQVRSRRIPALYVLGAQSDFGAYNALGTGLTVQPRGSQTDDVTPTLNPAFSRFTFEEDALRRFAAYPPAPAPFGDYWLGGGAEAALWQQVGRVRTQKPLLVFGGTPQQRQATLLTEGSWQWRLQEAVEHDDRPEAYDRLVNRTLQLLTQNANKKRLDVYPTQDAFSSQDDVTFAAETYNTIFERIYGQQITLTLTDEQQKTRTFTYTNAEDGAPLHLGALPGGLYRYVARATLSGQPQQDRGEVLVQEQQLEALQSHADHNLLYQLARRSNSRLYFPQQLQQLTDDILKADYKPVIYSQEDLKDLINLKWLFFVLLALATLEWATRKYSGGV